MKLPWRRAVTATRTNDEAKGPSSTAQRVAAHRLTFERVAATYGDSAADAALTRNVASGQPVRPGRMHDYLRARTAFFDRAVVEALDDGFTQVVIAGAGYDGRAFRYSKPGVQWFELDHPGTQQDKLRRLHGLGVATEAVRYVPADFVTDPVAQLLLSAGLSPGLTSLFLVEGVAVYLELEVLDRLLVQLRRAAGDGSRLAISLSRGPATYDAIYRARLEAAVASMGEPFRSMVGAEEAPDFLRRSGWQVLTGGGSGIQGGAAQQRARLAGLVMAAAGPADY